MRRLHNTLYVLTEESYLMLDGENVVISHDNETLGRFPLHNLEAINYFGFKGASPRLMGECVNRGIDFCFYSRHGRFLARTSGESRGNVSLRKTQYRIYDDKDASCVIARNFIIGKLFNSRWVLERATRDHLMQVDSERLKAVSASLAAAIKQARVTSTLDELRGIEGASAQHYFSVFGELVLRDKDSFSFHGRSRRPPLDRANALLSFAYSLLANSCAAALEGVGLDSYSGFLHQDRPGRKSLALDLMEELRSVFADRVVLDCINNRVIGPNQFDLQENGATYLNDDGRRAFLNAWQSKKQEVITHPFLSEKIPWGLVPHAQALLLARHLRGDLEAYPPFLWK